MKFYFIVLLACSQTLFSQVNYNINTGHSNIGFAIQWNEYGFRTGNFNSFAGYLESPNENSFQDAKVNLTVQVGSISLIAPNLERMVQGKEYLDSASCPIITFKTEKLKKKKKNTYIASGELNIKCKTYVTDFFVEALGYKGKKAYLKVTGDISKSNFDIIGGGDRLGNLIKITAFFELEKKE